MKIKRADLEGSLKHYLQNLAIRAVFRVAFLLPYGPRVRMVGWITSRIIGPLAGYNARVAANLNYVMPDLPHREVKRLMRGVTDNAGRTLMEIYSGDAFVERMKSVPFEGAGVEALYAARDNRTPVILVTGHFGNYDVPRGALNAQGFNLGALYNPMRNPFFNAHYEQAIGAIGQPIFPRGRRGFARLLRHLSGGGMIGFLVDVFNGGGAKLSYFGKPAMTALSAAELALKYNALVIPIYGIRQEDGLSFKVQVEPPIAHTTPEDMTQALNDSLEAVTRQHMEQWFWIHRRWKPEKVALIDAKRAKKMGPS
ncbi:lysophospholipid acyltransferase family protein [Celeribacter marinus]|uniref:lysophospholipid acyltransferase family protein n=1 Tax=Celeribacter marinus TaxID=1397108 RepID=UPI003F6BFDA0